MKYKAIIETDDYKDFEFFEDGNGKYIHGIDAGAVNNEWIALYFTECEQEPCNTCGYEEGSIYCKEHCPHEAKIEQESCDNVISRQAVLDEIRKCRSVVDAIEKIRGLPPVSSQPKTGHWIQENSVLICSICDARVARYDRYPYCPNCGAKMIELKER